METKHTPGPWFLPGDDPTKWGLSETMVLATGGEDMIADCSMLNGLSLEQCRANSRLIAAAPELLEVLEEILANVFFEKKDESDPRNVNSYREKSKAVIAKATGQLQPA